MSAPRLSKSYEKMFLSIAEIGRQRTRASRWVEIRRGSLPAVCRNPKVVREGRLTAISAIALLPKTADCHLETLNEAEGAALVPVGVRAR